MILVALNNRRKAIELIIFVIFHFFGSLFTDFFAFPNFQDVYKASAIHNESFFIYLTSKAELSFEKSQ